MKIFNLLLAISITQVVSAQTTNHFFPFLTKSSFSVATSGRTIKIVCQLSDDKVRVKQVENGNVSTSLNNIRFTNEIQNSDEMFEAINEIRKGELKDLPVPQGARPVSYLVEVTKLGTIQTPLFIRTAQKVIKNKAIQTTALMELMDQNCK